MPAGSTSLAHDTDCVRFILQMCKLDPCRSAYAQHLRDSVAVVSLSSQVTS